MNVCRLGQPDIQSVASLMARLKPGFWDAEGACAQLNSGVGWYLESTGERLPVLEAGQEVGSLGETMSFELPP